MTRIPTLLATLATSLVLGLGACASQAKKVEEPKDTKEVKDETPPDETTPDEPTPDEMNPEETKAEGETTEEAAPAEE